MRGKAESTTNSPDEQRITPAYAGKRYPAAYPVNRTQDHPRLCGEKLSNWRKKKMKEGITPAYAGKSFNVRVSFFDFWDHPRLCGEK